MPITTTAPPPAVAIAPSPSNSADLTPLAMVSLRTIKYLHSTSLIALQFARADDRPFRVGPFASSIMRPFSSRHAAGLAVSWCLIPTHVDRPSPSDSIFRVHTCGQTTTPTEEGTRRASCSCVVQEHRRSDFCSLPSASPAVAF